MTGVAMQLAEAAVSVRNRGLPAHLRRDVQMRILDMVGNSLAATCGEPAGLVRSMTEGWGGVQESSTVLGSSMPAPSAALVNGVLAHALDFDDTHLPSVLHPSSSVIPAALAVAEASGVEGALVISAIGVGVELTVRLGMAGYDRRLGNSVFFERGLHATSICGAIGAAVASAMTRGLDADGIASSIGIAASMGAGLLEANRTGGTVKRVHCGWAAHCGVVASDLALHGLTGPPTVLEGRFGFLQAYVGERANMNAITEAFGAEWELPGIFFKPYPCNHFTHAGIDAALALRRRGIDPADVIDVELGVPGPVLRTIGRPLAEKARPRSGYHAAFSGPYTVAAAWLGGGGLGVSHEDFTEDAIRDPRRQALASKVRCVSDERCDEIYPWQFPAVIRAKLRSGVVVTERVDVNRGGPRNPLTRESLEQKFRINALRAVDEEQIKSIQDAIAHLPEAANVHQLSKALRASAT